MTAEFGGLTLHLFVLSYDLGFNDGTPLTILQSVVVQLCKESKNINIVYGNLHMICVIQTLEAKPSDLNNNNVSDVQRSWFVQRQQALSRHNKTKDFDEESMLDSIMNLHRAYHNDISILEKSDDNRPCSVNNSLRGS